jgi:hypothetical protein
VQEGQHLGSKERRPPGFDGSAAVTRSLLGYGVVAGAFYLVVGVVLGLTREGFEFSSHPLSLLMLGEQGWMQRANLMLTGLMTIAAAFGVARAMSGSSRARRAGILLAVFGAALVGSGIFAPDPMAGFPPGAAGGEATLAGILHLAFGAVGFICLAAAAFVVAGWCAERSESTQALYFRVGGAAVILGFVGGAALATQTIGVVALWIAVVTGWVWLAVAAVHLYRTVPHPDPDRREPQLA